MAASQDTKNRVSNITKSAGKAAKGLGRFATHFVIETLTPGEVGMLIRGLIPHKKIVFTEREKTKIRAALTEKMSIFRATDLEPKPNQLHVVAGDPTALFIPVSTSSSKLIGTLKSTLAKTNEGGLDVKEGNFAILLKKKSQGSKDGTQKFTAELLKKTNVWFSIESAFVYTNGYASLNRVIELAELHSSGVLRLDISQGTKESDENTKILYKDNKWKYLDDEVAGALVEGIARKLGTWVDKLRSPGGFEEMILSIQMGNYLGLSDTNALKEANKRLPTFQNKLGYEFRSRQSNTKAKIEVTLELQPVKERSLLYIFDIDPDVPAFRDFSILVNLAEKEITFTYNNHANKFEKTVKKVSVGNKLDFTKKILKSNNDSNSLWIELEDLIIRTLKEEKGDVLKSFKKLFDAMF